MLGGTPGEVLYAQLPAVVTLAANTPYILLSRETGGGDSWYDANPVVTTDAVSVTGPTYWEYGSQYFTPRGWEGKSFVPVS